MIQWSFYFTKVSTESYKHPKIIYMAIFRDGKFHLSKVNPNSPEIVKYMQFLSYITFFPDKNFVKVKFRDHVGQFSVHFLDKTFLEKGFIGCFSVIENDTPKTFETWGVEEMMGKYAFEYFYEEVMDKTEDYSEFLHWLNDQVQMFYDDWQEAQQAFLAPNKQKKEPTTEKSKKKSSGHSVQAKISIINEYGQPLVDLISFTNNIPLIHGTADDKANQNLESMSLTALKTLIETQGKDLEIEYLKQALTLDMGHQFIFFKKITIKNIGYAHTLTSAQYDFEKKEFTPVLTGKEIPLLHAIGHHLKINASLLSSRGLLKHPEDQKIVHQFMIEAVKKFR